MRYERSDFPIMVFNGRIWQTRLVIQRMTRAPPFHERTICRSQVLRLVPAELNPQGTKYRRILSRRIRIDKNPRKRCVPDCIPDFKLTYENLPKHPKFFYGIMLRCSQSQAERFRARFRITLYERKRPGGVNRAFPNFPSSS